MYNKQEINVLSRTTSNIHGRIGLLVQFSYSSIGRLVQFPTTLQFSYKQLFNEPGLPPRKEQADIVGAFVS